MPTTFYNNFCRINEEGSIFNITSDHDFEIQVYDGDDQYFVNKGTLQVNVVIGIRIYIYARFENRGYVHVISGGILCIRASGSEHTGSWTYQVKIKYEV